MQDTTKRGWRGAGVALLVVVFIFGSVLVIGMGGWYAFALFTLALVILGGLVMWATRTGEPEHLG